MNLNGKRVVIAKINQIADVAISLPMAALIKKSFPKAKVIFLTSGDACDIARLDKNIDEVYDWQHLFSFSDPVKQIKKLKTDLFIHASPCRKLAQYVKKAEVPVRLGSLYRTYNWLTCNRLAPISRRPGLNKRMLDIEYLKALDMDVNITEAKLAGLYQLKSIPLKKAHQALLSKDKFNLVIHPNGLTDKSDALSIKHYQSLIRSLNKDKFHILISGTAEEREHFSLLCEEAGVVDIMGRMTLATYFNFLKHVDGLVSANSTAIHLACAHNKPVVGLYRHKQRDIKRWGPIGAHSSVLSARGGINNIPVNKIKDRLADWVI